MKWNRLAAASGLMVLAPPLQESTGFLGIDWWVWILVGVLLLLLLLIIGFILQNEPGPPIPERESKMYVTAATAARAQPKTEPEQEPEPEEASEPDDLSRIEGVGPKVAGLLNDAGITTFAALAETDVDKLNQLLEENELQFMEAESWPQQAALAAKGDWNAFEKLTAELKGGRREN